jgi:hypothetical protein
MAIYQEYKVLPSGDYLQVLCAEHHQRCELSFDGFDPVIPKVEITCPTHGSSGEWKLDGYDEKYLLGSVMG